MPTVIEMTGAKEGDRVKVVNPETSSCRDTKKKPPNLVLLVTDFGVTDLRFELFFVAQISLG